MKRFKKFYLEITNICNLNCDFCPRTKRRPEYMSVESFTYILDQIKDYTDYLYFHVKGEPLLHPQLGELLDISYNKGFQVNITANGTLLPRVKEQLLPKPALRQMNFSLHSFDEKDGIIKREQYLAQIISFIKEAKDRTGMILALRLWNLEENNAVNILKKRNEELLAIIEKEFELPSPILEMVTPGHGVKIAERIFLNQDYQFQWPDLKEEEDDGMGFCYGLRNQIAVLVDGTVVPCCLDGEGVISLGNIKENSLKDILDGTRAVNLVNGFSRREAVEELCRKCGYRKRFG